MSEFFYGAALWAFATYGAIAFVKDAWRIVQNCKRKPDVYVDIEPPKPYLSFRGLSYNSSRDRFAIMLNMNRDDAERMKAITQLAGIDFDYSEHALFASNVPANGRLRISPPTPLSDEQKSAIVALLDEPPAELEAQ